MARYQILDTLPDGAFDRVAGIGREAVRGVDGHGEHCGYRPGVVQGKSWSVRGRGTNRDPGLCASVILDGEPYLVSDAKTDPRTARHPLVTGETGMQFYAAAPIVTADGYRLGTLAVMDTEPNEATPEHLEMLEDLAAVVMDQLELRLAAMNVLGDGQMMRIQASPEQLAQQPPQPRSRSLRPGGDETRPY